MGYLSDMQMVMDDMSNLSKSNCKGDQLPKEILNKLIENRKLIKRAANAIRKKPVLKQLWDSVPMHELKKKIDSEFVLCEDRAINCYIHLAERAAAALKMGNQTVYIGCIVSITPMVGSYLDKVMEKKS